MSVFAGFWVDGAVRKPEARHCNSDGLVCTRHKETGKIDQWDIENVEDVDYWLDTTPRESLNPEELLSVLQILWPKVEVVGKHLSGTWYVDDIEAGIEINWGELTQYPPPAEPEWVRITRENVGQYLFSLCRLRDGLDKEWRDGHIVGWCMNDDCCLVESDVHPIERVLSWNFVEVRNAATL